MMRILGPTIFISVLCSLSPVGCRTRGSEQTHATTREAIGSVSNSEGDTNPVAGRTRVCDEPAPETRYILDEPTGRFLERNEAEFNIVETQLAATSPEDIERLPDIDQRKAVFMWTQSTFSGIRLVQAFETDAIENGLSGVRGGDSVMVSRALKKLR